MISIRKRAVVFFFLVIGILNIALGFALAIYLEYQTAPKQDVMQLSLSSVLEGKGRIKLGSPALPSTDNSSKSEEELSLEDVEEIPSEWLDMLEGSRETNSLVEAAAEVLRLEVGKYREQMVRLDIKIREMAASADYSSLEELIQQVKELNEDWLEVQTGALAHLTDRQDTLGDNAVVGAALEDVLLDQSAQIETTISNIKMLDPTADLEKCCKKLVLENGRLIDLAHVLRDRMVNSIAVIMNSEKRLADLDEGLGTDGLTGLLGRVGTEALFENWRQDPANITRTSSVGLMNIDHFSQFNKKYGFPKGDELIGAIGRILPDMIRKDRGLDRAAHIEGNTYLIFFGDTGPRNALSVMERIRQTIEESTIQMLEESLEITVSVAVCESESETATAILKRTASAMKYAKKQGGNTAVIDEGKGPKSSKPPEFKVKGRTITLMS